MTKRSRPGPRNGLRIIAAAGTLAAGLILPALGATVPAQAAAGGLGPPNTFVPAGPLGVAQSGQTATPLPDGQVLVAAGGTANAELYNPATRSFAPTGKMPVAVRNATATLLPNGKVLVAGGLQGAHQVANAELYDPATGTWAATGAMTVARSGQTATLLPDGQVLVAGGGCNGHGYGCDAGSFEAAQASAELYNPATGTWTATAPMAARHAGQTATLLRNGWVLVAGGGTAVAELYEPQRGIWVSPGPMSTARTHQTAALLPNGHVLVAGGDGPDGRPLSTAEEFLAGKGPLAAVSAGSIPFGGQQVGTVSAAHFYTVTNAGSAALVVTGATVTGKNPGDFRVRTGCAGAPVPPGGSCTVSVRFAPSSISLRSGMASVADNAPRSPQGVAVTGYGGGPDAWTPAGPMTTAREHFTATLLANGKVLMAGGQSGTGASLGTAELYDPATRSFTPTGSLNAARSYPAAAALPGGKVLIAGGLSSNFIALNSAELYDPATGTWSPTASMNDARYGATATVLPDGTVLAAGGCGACGHQPALASTELFDGSFWFPVTAMTQPRVFQTATPLPGGSVLVAGGGASYYGPARTSSPRAAAAVSPPRTSRSP